MTRTDAEAAIIFADGIVWRNLWAGAIPDKTRVDVLGNHGWQYVIQRGDDTIATAGRPAELVDEAIKLHPLEEWEESV